MIDLDKIFNLKDTFSGGGSDNTSEGAIIREGGKHIEKEITLNANNTSARVNVFQVTGYNQVFNIHGYVTDATTLNNLTNAYFDLWDGTNTVPLTKTTGATMSGFAVDSAFIKDADVTTALTTINNSQCRMNEAAVGAKEGAPFTVMQKALTNTYIRFNYTTTDAPINAKLAIQLVFADINAGTIIPA